MLVTFTPKIIYLEYILTDKILAFLSFLCHLLEHSICLPLTNMRCVLFFIYKLNANFNYEIIEAYEIYVFIIMNIYLSCILCIYICIYSICNVYVFASIYLFLKKKWIGRPLNNADTAEKCKDFIKRKDCSEVCVMHKI